MFSTLTPAQIARIDAHGSVRPLHEGEVLFEVGEHAIPFFPVTGGASAEPGEHWLFCYPDKAFVEC